MNLLNVLQNLPVSVRVIYIGQNECYPGFVWEHEHACILDGEVMKLLRITRMYAPCYIILKPPPKLHICSSLSTGSAAPISHSENTDNISISPCTCLGQAKPRFKGTLGGVHALFTYDRTVARCSQRRSKRCYHAQLLHCLFTLSRVASGAEDYPFN